MKAIMYKSIAFCLMALMLWSCKKDEVRSVISAEGTGSTLQASSTNVVLVKANENDDAVTFNLTDPDFGYQAAVRNVLQLGVKGTNFSAPKEVDLGAKTLSQTYTGLQFNQMLLALNLPFDAATDIEVRVKSEVGGSVQPLYSNVLSMSVQPYPLISWVYVPGNYQGWNPPTADSLISATGNGVYKGIIYFPANGDNNYEFKITPAKKWDIAYGDAGGGKASTTGGNFKAPAAGSYEITFDSNELTFEIKKLSWGIIGSATPTGWDSDTDLKYNNTTGTWSVTIALVPGAYKFRLNDDWGTNLGGSNGTLSAGGSDINVAEAGTYKIELDVTGLTYTITKQ